MLGTHSELRRSQMSHICDISGLRVNVDTGLREKKDPSFYNLAHMNS